MKMKKVFWWEDPKNKETISFPISIIKSDDVWVASCNNETKKLLGDKVNVCSQGETKEDAIKKFFEGIKYLYDYSEECVLNYQRFVPLRKGNWKHNGGKWLVIFGFHFSFRYGKNMKGGMYVLFSKLNISFVNEWKLYKNYKSNKKQQ